MYAKKTQKTRIPSAKSVIAICAVALMIGAWFLTKSGFKILNTQLKLYSYYHAIEAANSKHDYYLDKALTYSYAGYMDEAEEWDERADTLSKERADFVASATDSTVIWALRDGVDLVTILVSLAVLVIAIALWGIGIYVIACLIVIALDEERK